MKDVDEKTLERFVVVAMICYRSSDASPYLTELEELTSKIEAATNLPDGWADALCDPEDLPS